MKYASFLAVLIAVGLSAISRANAEAVTYDISGIYAADASTTDFTAPNAPFSFEFTVPQTVSIPLLNPPGPLFFSNSILSGSFAFNGSSSPASSGSYTYSESGDNLTEISLNTTSGEIVIDGEEGSLSNIFTLNKNETQANFLTGNLGPGGGGFVSFIFTTTEINAGAAFTKVVGTAVPVPEPSCFALIALGAICIASSLLLRRQKLIA